MTTTNTGRLRTSRLVRSHLEITPPSRHNDAIALSSFVMPTFPSIRKNTMSAFSTAYSVCLLICCSVIVIPFLSGTYPPVSIRLNSSPLMCPSPSRRSRVVPASLLTSASRRPTSRLNRVDLPTFVRPTRATVNCFVCTTFGIFSCFVFFFFMLQINQTNHVNSIFMYCLCMDEMDRVCCKDSRGCGFIAWRVRRVHCPLPPRCILWIALENVREESRLPWAATPR